MDIVIFYRDTITRVFFDAWSWMVGQGIWLGVATLVPSSLYAAAKAYTGATYRRAIMNALLAFIADFARGAWVAVGLVLIFIFVIFFIADAPKQAKMASDREAALAAALKEKQQSSIRTDYQNTRRWVIPPEDRSGYNTWAVRVGISTPATLKNPRVMLVWSEKLNQPTWKEPIEVPTQLAWYSAEHPWDLPESIGHSYFVPFLADASGSQLFLFTKENPAHELASLVQGVPPGSYRFYVVIRSDNSDPLICALYVTWNGKMSDFTMSVEEGVSYPTTVTNLPAEAPPIPTTPTQLEKK